MRQVSVDIGGTFTD
ncbi:hypothetical protein, partial [Frankia casuarinae]